MKWTRKDSRTASAQGWDLFDTGTTDSPQLQRIDLPNDGETPPVFVDDNDAWVFVVKQSLDGNALCQKALDILAKENPSEWVRVTTAKRGRKPWGVGKA